MAADILLHDIDGCRWATTSASTSSWPVTSRIGSTRDYGETFTVPRAVHPGRRADRRPGRADPQDGQDHASRPRASSSCSTRRT